MWFSLPCGPNRPVQNLNQKNLEQIRNPKKKRRKAKRIIRRCLKLAREQVNRGGHIGWEWPRTNLGWQDTEIQSFFRSLSQEGLLHVARLDGCQVGVMAHDSGLLMKKPWTIKTTSANMARTLDLSCPGDHEHDACS